MIGAAYLFGACVTLAYFLVVGGRPRYWSEYAAVGLIVALWPLAWFVSIGFRAGR